MKRDVSDSSNREDATYYLTGLSYIFDEPEVIDADAKGIVEDVREAIEHLLAKAIVANGKGTKQIPGLLGRIRRIVEQYDVCNATMNDGDNKEDIRREKQRLYKLFPKEMKGGK